MRVLQIDHIDKDGHHHRRDTKGSKDKRWLAYAEAIRAGSHRLQILCPTCHVLKDLSRLLPTPEVEAAADRLRA